MFKTTTTFPYPPIKKMKKKIEVINKKKVLWSKKRCYVNMIEFKIK